MSLFTTLVLPCASPAMTDDTLQSINHLLHYIEESDCVFIRNGNEHNAKEAAKHIKTKYDALMGNIHTAEEFIERAASKSILGGQPYMVRCAGNTPVLSTEWLTKELFNYRKTLQDDALPK